MSSVQPRSGLWHASDPKKGEVSFFHFDRANVIRFLPEAGHLEAFWATTSVTFNIPGDRSKMHLMYHLGVISWWEWTCYRTGEWFSPGTKVTWIMDSKHTDIDWWQLVRLVLCWLVIAAATLACAWLFA